MTAISSPCFDLRHLPVLCQKIAGLADRADNIEDRFPGGRVLHDRPDLVVGFVQARPDQVVHAGIDDQEPLLAAVLMVERVRDQDPGVAHDRPARLQDQRAAGASSASAGWPWPDPGDGAAFRPCR